MQHEARWAGDHGPEQTTAVLARMFDQAMKGDVQAARLYLDRVVGPVRIDKGDDIDLSTAPTAVLEWLAENGS